MSSHIVYHQIGVCLPKAFTGQAEDLFAILGQSGDSNCFECGTGGRDGRRSRSWSANAFGTAAQVMHQTIQIAGGCEGGGLKLNAVPGTTPEQYITRTRNLLKKAQAHDITQGAIAFKEGYVMMHFCHNGVQPLAFGTEAPAIQLDDRDALQALLATEQFKTMVLSTYAHSYLKVSGPEIRA